MKRKLSPPPYEAGECSSSGSRRPGHPHSTPWSSERAKTKLTTHVMQDSTLCPRQYLHAPLLCRGALCRVSHQPGKYNSLFWIFGRLLVKGWMSSDFSSTDCIYSYFKKNLNASKPSEHLPSGKKGLKA